MLYLSVFARHEIIWHDSLSLCFNGHFPGASWLAGTKMSQFWVLLELRMMDMVVTTGAIRHGSSSRIITTNKPTPSFYRSDALPIAQPTVSEN